MIKIDFLKKIFIGLIILSLFSLVVVLYFVLIKTDLATQPIDKTSLKFIEKEYEYKPPIALVSYGDHKPVFLSNQILLSESALNKNIQFIYNYSRQNLEKDFYHKNKFILKQPRGAGYWLWKPYVILKTMEKLPENSIILYADSGVVFSSSIDEKLLGLLEKYDIVAPADGGKTPIKKQLKKEAQIALGIDKNEEILNSTMVWAYFLAIKNNESTRKFIAKWLETCENADLLTDKPFSSGLQDPEFEAHLHDQSLLSVLFAQNPDKKLIMKRQILRSEFGIDNFHRHQEQQYTSPKMHIAGLNKKVADILYNNFIIQYVRKKLFENYLTQVEDK